MSEIVWVNPVQGASFDADTLAVIDAVRAPHHTPRIRHLEEGPPHLEYHLYEHEAFSPMLEIFQQAEGDGCGAAVIGCFYDGGLREAREALRMPVVGMGEASMLLAATLGHRFSVIVGRRKWIPKMTDNAVLLGMDRKLASFRSVDLGMPEFLENPEGFFDATIDEARGAVEHDGAEVVVLSELTSPAFCDRARAELPVPLVDPGMACWKWAEMLADLYEHAGLTHVDGLGYEAPPELRA